ncbi:CidA/LrgA family protein [Glaciecola sp. 1036]|uniref:CidA/LrgA family protein n=1 Tax=Alteromonadaceae TaxID=72275 RepID=UPI003CFD56EB
MGIIKTCCLFKHSIIKNLKLITPEKERLTSLQYIKRVLFNVGFALLGLLALILVFECADFLKRTFSIRLSSGLIGLVILFIFFIIYKKVPNPIATITLPLLKHMSLLFIPAIVMIVSYQEILLKHQLAIILAIVVASLIAYLVTLLIAKLTLSGVSNDTD